MRRVALMLQKLEAARWLTELEPQHPRSLYWLGVTACVEGWGTEQQRAAARAAPDASVAAFLGSTVARHLEALEASRHSACASPFWRTRLAYELFNFVVTSVGAHWPGLPPTEAARLLDEAEGLMRQISSAGVLPTAWIEVRRLSSASTVGARWACTLPCCLLGHDLLGQVLRVAPICAPLTASQSLRRQRLMARQVGIGCWAGGLDAVPAGLPSSCLANQQRSAPCTVAPAPHLHAQTPQYRNTLEEHLQHSPDRWTRDCVCEPAGGAARQPPRFKGFGSRCNGCGAYALETRACKACKAVVYCRCRGSTARAGGCQCAGWVRVAGNGRGEALGIWAGAGACCWVALPPLLTPLSDPNPGDPAASSARRTPGAPTSRNA